MTETAENPNVVYYSHLHDIDNFSGSDAGSVRLSDKVTGLKSFRGDCIVFCRNSIYRLVNIEANDATTAIIPITKNVGCLSGQSIQ